MRCKMEKTKGAVVLKYASSAAYPFSHEVARRLGQEFPPVLLGFTATATARHSFEARYDVTRLVPLSKHLKTPLDLAATAEMLGQFRDLIDFCVQDRLPLKNVVFEADRVFYDSWLRSVRFVYLPFDGIEPRLDAMSSFFGGVARKMRAADEGAARLIGLYREFFGDGAPFNPMELASYLGRMASSPGGGAQAPLSGGAGRAMQGAHVAPAFGRAGRAGVDAETSAVVPAAVQAATPQAGDGWRPGVIVDAAAASVPEGRHVRDLPASATVSMDAVEVPASGLAEAPSSAPASDEARDTDIVGDCAVDAPSDCPPTTVELAEPELPETAVEEPAGSENAEPAAKESAGSESPEPAAKEPAEPEGPETAAEAPAAPELPETTLEEPETAEPKPGSVVQPAPERFAPSRPADSATSIASESRLDPASGCGPQPQPQPAPQPQPQPAQPGPLRRYLMTRRSTGERFELHGQEYVVGKSMYCSFQVRDNMTVSRRHALFFCGQDACWMEDNNSTNGTFLNGRRVAPRARVRLRSGDVVSMSDEDFLFEESV